MGNYTVIDKGDGHIIRIVSIPDMFATKEAGSNEECKPGRYDDVKYYFDFKNDTFLETKSIPYSINKTQIDADGSDEAIITFPTTEPNGNEIYIQARINGDFQTVTDGELIFTSDIAGVFEVQCRAINYLPTKIEIEAV